MVEREEMGSGTKETGGIQNGGGCVNMGHQFVESLTAGGVSTTKICKEKSALYMTWLRAEI